MIQRELHANILLQNDTFDHVINPSYTRSRPQTMAIDAITLTVALALSICCISAATWHFDYMRVRSNALTPAGWAKSFEASVFNIKTEIACSSSCRKRGTCTHFSLKDKACHLGNDKIGNGSIVMGSELGDIYIESGQILQNVIC